MALKRVVSPSTGASTTMSAFDRLRAGRASGLLSIWTAMATLPSRVGSSTGSPFKGQATPGVGLGEGDGEGDGDGEGLTDAEADGLGEGEG